MEVSNSSFGKTFPSRSYLYHLCLFQKCKAFSWQGTDYIPKGKNLKPLKINTFCHLYKNQVDERKINNVRNPPENRQYVSGIMSNCEEKYSNGKKSRGHSTDSRTVVYDQAKQFQQIEVSPKKNILKSRD